MRLNRRPKVRPAPKVYPPPFPKRPARRRADLDLGPRVDLKLRLGHEHPLGLRRGLSQDLELHLRA